ncbi:MAG: tRNA (adenosine(37)-N6)-threonylcarbamoyltransferase complex transferase subunit TsaD [bacterium]
MIILAIETSCDDTCISIIEKKSQKPKVLANIVASQIKVHKQYGGVFPAMAKREHQRNLIPVLKKALQGAGMLKEIKNHKSQTINLKFKNLEKILEREPELAKKLIVFLEKYQPPKIDALAITIGPGLEPCLWVGINFARTLGLCWNLPLIPVNHLEAHILVNMLFPKKIEFPAICLIVSGGNTQLILVKGIGKYKVIGETRDDAAGECFDKTARLLGLDYPGGPIISKIAMEAKFPRNIKLPRPMIYEKNYDFSFSGLKTAVLYNFKGQSEKTQKSKKYIREMCAEIQQSIIDVLIHKTLQAAKNYKAKTVILGGGVTANQELRRQLQEKLDIKLQAPPAEFCTDNAAMVGVAGCYKQKFKSWKNIKAKANLKL